MRVAILNWAITLTVAGPMGLCQYNIQGVYCGMNTASKVILVFTTQLYSWLCNYNAIVVIVCNRNTPNSQYTRLLIPDP